MSNDDEVTPAVVDIAGNVPGAVRIQGIELQVGDLVFDATGGTHRLVSVRGPLANGAISYKRDDYPVREYIDRSETITVIRGDRVKAEKEQK